LRHISPFYDHENEFLIFKKKNQMLGNILIVISLISYGLLASLLSKPMPGGDYGVGYSLAFLYLGAGFIISSGLLAWNMNVNHCFDWLPTSFLRYRNWLVFLGWIAFVIAVMWSSEYQSKQLNDAFPQFMTWFIGSKVHIWLPFLVFIPSLYLINAERLTGIAPFGVKMAVQAGFSISFFMALCFLFVMMRRNIQKEIALNKTVEETKMENMRKYGTKDPSWVLENSIDQIDRYAEKTVVGLLQYTFNENKYVGKDEAEKIRNAAIAKMKSYENWETDLIHILEGKEIGSLYNMYGFLDGFKIEHREKFIQPIKNSITWVTSVTQKSIKVPDDFFLGSTNIVALCRILDAQFKESAAEFRPSILTLQQVLDTTPAKRSDTKYEDGFNEILQKSRLAVKNWLDANQ
jgi:hypothetical protein